MQDLATSREEATKQASHGRSMQGYDMLPSPQGSKPYLQTLLL